MLLKVWHHFLESITAYCKSQHYSLKDISLASYLYIWCLYVHDVVTWEHRMVKMSLCTHTRLILGEMHCIYKVIPEWAFITNMLFFLSQIPWSFFVYNYWICHWTSLCLLCSHIFSQHYTEVFLAGHAIFCFLIFVACVIVWDSISLVSLLSLPCLYLHYPTLFYFVKIACWFFLSIHE